MLKRMIVKRVVLASTILILLCLFYFFPRENKYTLDPDKSIEYVSSSKQVIYLLDKDNYIARTKVAINTEDNVETAKILLETLIMDGKKESSIPNGFRAILPSDVRINSVVLENGVLKIDVSKEILDINKELEQKMIEAITYTMCNIKGIDSVLIYVEGVELKKLSKSSYMLPELLNLNLGINKEYDIVSTNDISKTTVYYVNKHNEGYYYVPVTKYSNSTKDKVKIIIDELSSGLIYESNLMSFLNSNVKLLDYKLEDDRMILNFNSYLFDDIDNKKILEEVIYTISLSIGVNYDVNEVVFMVDNVEIEKSVLKSIEN